MNIIVFGATGGTGQQLVSQAIEKGLHVTAFVRSPEKMAIKHPNLVVFKGDVLHYEQVERAMIGQEAVLCALGIGKQVNSKSVVHSVQRIHLSSPNIKILNKKV